MNRSLRWMVLPIVCAGLLYLWHSSPPLESDMPTLEDSPPQPARAKRDRSRPGESRRVDTVATPSREETKAEAAPPPALAADAPQLAASRAGLAVDASGNFFPDSKTIERFESSLAAEPPERSLPKIRSDIAKSLDPPAEGQALEFLERYLAYRTRGIELGLNEDVVIDFRPRFAQLRSLRREFFGIDVGQRLFGEEERQANIAIREHEIDSDPDLSEEERAVLLEELHAPPVYRNE